MLLKKFCEKREREREREGGREREREDDAHYRIDFWWVFIDFYFSKKRWFNLDFSAREAQKNFCWKKKKHVSACMSVLLGM